MIFSVTEYGGVTGDCLAELILLGDPLCGAQ